MSKQRATIKEIAQAAGVSVATAGRVIGGYGYVSAEKRAKVDSIAREMSFTPNALAQGLRASCTKTIGVVLSDIKNPFFSGVLSRIESAARSEGYNTIICNTNEDVATEVELMKVLYSKRVDGIIISSAYKVNQAIAPEDLPLYNSDTPIVFIDRAVRNLNSVVVEIDNVKGGYDATQYLLQLGHKHIGIVAPPRIVTVENRIRGYKKALAEAGVPFEKKNIFRYDTIMPDPHKLIIKWLQSQPQLSAIFCLNCDGLMDVINAIEEQGKAIPQDYSLICWDDCEIARFLKLTIVKQPVEQLGLVATQHLLAHINKSVAEPGSLQRRTLLSADLIKRNSVHKK
ncbi:MAG: LacI family DNA-binding transcriptional regulator [Candidatus Pelethousia sp.]|nr:LacI family DNA-binding transcriptional regulator [Candidatus Pelethousia sp.]